jgi:AcrR family transcriptional regulator
MAETKSVGPRRRSREQYETRRQEIVDAAAHAFASRGYHATSIDDLVQATGLQRGGLYHYIGSKEELLFQIHERFIEPLLEAAHEIEARAESPSETLEQLAYALMRDIANYRDQVTVFLHEWKTLRYSDDVARVERVLTARRQFEDVIDRTIRRGVDAGVFDVDDRRLAVLAFLGMINYTYQWFDPAGSMTADDVARTFATYFLRGIERRDTPTVE